MNPKKLIIAIATILVAGAIVYLALPKTSLETIGQQGMSPVSSDESLTKPEAGVERPQLKTVVVPLSSLGDTSSWKTYTNSAFSYSLKLPQDAKILGGAGEPESISWKLPFTGQVFAGAYNSFTAVVQNSAQDSRCQEEYSLNKKAIGDNTFFYDQQPTGGMSTWGNEWIYAITRNNKCYYFKLYIGGEKDENYYKPHASQEINYDLEARIIDQILSTLKFTDSK